MVHHGDHPAAVPRADVLVVVLLVLVMRRCRCRRFGVATHLGPLAIALLVVADLVVVLNLQTLRSTDRLAGHASVDLLPLSVLVLVVGQLLVQQVPLGQLA